MQTPTRPMPIIAANVISTAFIFVSSFVFVIVSRRDILHDESVK
jgi:hypothetical protein